MSLDLVLEPEGPLPTAARHLVQQALFILQAGAFAELDSAAWVLARWFLLPPEPDSDRPAFQRITVSLRDPAGQAWLRAEAEDQEYEVELKDWGTVDVVAETAHQGFYRLTLAPGGLLPEHHHLHMHEAELIVGPGLVGWMDGRAPRPLPLGTLHRWRHGQRHGYRNPGPRSASLLCMDAPPFDPDDEITEPLGSP